MTEACTHPSNESQNKSPDSQNHTVTREKLFFSLAGVTHGNEYAERTL